MRDHRHDGEPEISQISIDEAMRSAGPAVRTPELREELAQLSRMLEVPRRKTSAHAGELRRRLERAERGGARRTVRPRKRRPDHTRRSMQKASRRRNR